MSMSSDQKERDLYLLYELEWWIEYQALPETLKLDPLLGSPLELPPPSED
jgi:hypothetical protein